MREGRKIKNGQAPDKTSVLVSFVIKLVPQRYLLASTSDHKKIFVKKNRLLN